MDHLEHLNHITPESSNLKENIPNLFNLSSYDKFLKLGITLVALLWTPSSTSASYTFIGVQNCMQHSKCSLTYDAYSFENTPEDLYDTLQFIISNIE